MAVSATAARCKGSPPRSLVASAHRESDQNHRLCRPRAAVTPPWRQPPRRAGCRDVGPPCSRTRAADLKHRRPSEPSSRGHRETGLSPEEMPPFRPGRMLVRSIERTVQGVPLVVTVPLKRLKQPVPLARLRPTTETVENGLPRPKLLRKITPRHARATPPQHRLDEVAVIHARATRALLR